MISLSFFGVILLGAFLLSTPLSTKSGEWLSFTDAFFTSASAVSVTGLITTPTAVTFSVFGQVVIMLLIEIGGLGFMTLSSLVFLIIRKRITLKERLLMQEALGKDSPAGIVRMVRKIAILTGISELAGFALLLPSMIGSYGAAGIFKAMFLSVSAFCNAGFDIFGTSGTPYASLTIFSKNALVLLPVAFLVIIGGLGFSVMSEVLTPRKKRRRLSLHAKVVLTATSVILAAGTIFFMLNEFGGNAMEGNFMVKLLNSFFQTVTSRTAGFNTVDQASLTGQSRLFTILLMFIGASPGSTGGGVKTTAMVTMIFIIYSAMRQKKEVVAGGYTLSRNNIYKAVTVVVFFLLLIFTMTLLIMIFESKAMASNAAINFESILFESTSAVSTTGLSMGITADLCSASKYVLAFGMFFGRVGPLTLAVALITNAKDQNAIQYPEGGVMIG